MIKGRPLYIAQYYVITHKNKPNTKNFNLRLQQQHLHQIYTMWHVKKINNSPLEI